MNTLEVVHIPNTSVQSGHNMEFEDYMAFLDAMEKELVEEQCGKKNGRKNVSKYRRYKTKFRTIHTCHGTITRRFVYIKSDDCEAFSPLLDYLGIEKHQHASKKFKEVCAKKASRSTYRDSSIDFMDSNNVDISHTAIWAYTKEACNGLEGTTESGDGDPNRIVVADGQKLIT